MVLDHELESVWQNGKIREGSPAPLTANDLQGIISSRVRRERKTVGEFVWAAIMYQLILYSFLAYTLIRHWGNMQVLLLCLAGGALYIPLTFALIHRVRTLYRRPEAHESAVPDVLDNVKREYARLSDFFKFKKRMDWIGVPVSCAIVVLVTFSLFVEGGVERNPLSSFAFFALWVGMSLVAVYLENRKRFIYPLRNLKQLLEDLNNT